jgi:arsenate reductase
MAEGWARRLKGDLIEPFSAGTVAKGLDPLAVKAMAETGVDISGYKSKTVADLPKVEFDYVVTVCSDADANCPFFPAKTRVVHRGFDDPPRLAAGETETEKKMAHYRRVRDEIRDFMEALPGALKTM